VLTMNAMLHLLILGACGPTEAFATARAAFTMWSAAPCFNPSDHIAVMQPKPGCGRSEFSINNDRTLWLL
jgi:hypothetical protein